ncbi:MAG: rod shape-determining protein RodA [Candidatus Omnitrophota bacterium]
MRPPWLRKVPLALVFSVFLLAGFGILSVYSATASRGGLFAWRQLNWCGLGLVLFLLMGYFNYRSLLGISYLFYACALILLVGVLVFGEVRQGAQRWFQVGPLAVQPSEFAKLATLMTLAHFLGSIQPWDDKNRALIISLILVLVPMALIAKQPDLGSAIVFLPMAIGLFFLWGIRYRYLIVAALTGLVLAPVFWAFLHDYQRKRILVFLNPKLDPLGAGYTALQAKIAVGSGGLWGKGFLKGTQGQLDFVPEHHTDFIFCVVGEEFGFLGVILLLVLYGVLFRAIFQAMESTTDTRAKLLGAGVISILFAQVFVNIGMSIGLMPITGIPLPLVSYGGSSFLATAFALGLIHSIHRQRTIF